MSVDRSAEGKALFMETWDALRERIGADWHRLEHATISASMTGERFTVEVQFHERIDLRSSIYTLSAPSAKSEAHWRPRASGSPPRWRERRWSRSTTHSTA